MFAERSFEAAENDTSAGYRTFSAAPASCNVEGQAPSSLRYELCICLGVTSGSNICADRWVGTYWSFEGYYSFRAKDLTWRTAAGNCGV